MRRYCFYTVVAAALCSTSLASADESRRVGVVVTLNVGVDKDVLDAKLAELALALSEEVGVDVISGDDVVRRLPEEGLPEECVAQPACRNDLSRRLDAEELLLLVVVNVGDEIQIDSTWADIESGRTTSRPRLVISDSANSKEIIRAHVAKLLPHIKKSKPDPIVVVVPPPTPVEDPPARTMTIPAWIALGVGGSALVGGSLFALSARSKFNALERDMCDVDECDNARIDSGKRHALSADILFGIGLAGVATAAVLYLLSEPERPAVNVTPTKSGAVVSLLGAF